MSLKKNLLFFLLCFSFSWCLTNISAASKNYYVFSNNLYINSINEPSPFYALTFKDDSSTHTSSYKIKAISMRDHYIGVKLDAIQPEKIKESKSWNCFSINPTEEQGLDQNVLENIDSHSVVIFDLNEIVKKPKMDQIPEEQNLSRNFMIEGLPPFPLPLPLMYAFKEDSEGEEVYVINKISLAGQMTEDYDHIQFQWQDTTDESEILGIENFMNLSQPCTLSLGKMSHLFNHLLLNESVITR